MVSTDVVSVDYVLTLCLKLTMQPKNKIQTLLSHPHIHGAVSGSSRQISITSFS